LSSWAKIGPLAVVFVLSLLSCTQGAQPTGTGRSAPGSDTRPAASAPQKTFVIAIRGELPSVAAKPLIPFSMALYPPLYLFNATLDYRDEREVAKPYLAEALPELNTDTWKVFPDGRMETTYRLRPNLTWHDGMPLSAEDFVFAYRVYAKPELGAANTPPIGMMEDVLAPDDRTVVIRWRQTYPDAAIMAEGWLIGFQSLPGTPSRSSSAAWTRSRSARSHSGHRSTSGSGPSRSNRGSRART
jgi:ABC-type transport system substrate-binding protein